MQKLAVAAGFCAVASRGPKAGGARSETHIVRKKTPRLPVNETFVMEGAEVVGQLRQKWI
jgi:hypothetical protein